MNKKMPTIESLANKLSKMEIKLKKCTNDIKESKAKSIDTVSTKKLKEKIKEKNDAKKNNKEKRKSNDYIKALTKARDAGQKTFTYVRKSKSEEGKKEKCIYKLDENSKTPFKVYKLYKTQSIVD